MLLLWGYITLLVEKYMCVVSVCPVFCHSCCSGLMYYIVFKLFVNAPSHNTQQSYKPWSFESREDLIKFSMYLLKHTKHMKDCPKGINLRRPRVKKNICIDFYTFFYKILYQNTETGWNFANKCLLSFKPVAVIASFYAWPMLPLSATQ